ncbi:MAG: type II toxin-antitoxin system HicB family antitoxin [Leptospiraceae bacterium]|nr:type II toxin-antitoxin system HicB family antitoxin [Leptospiraceae bacterium]MCK6382702.1 type II toxin-antitoxin system HicB family antitoxin [Leptospiraceae bacterium]NUM42570.1 type II toxin-antitoxin system HicB family antitoxin [Leptospiraceae bacterium]
MEYLVILEFGSNNWSAYVPDLPGCVAVAETREETLELMKDAIQGHLEVMRMNGEEIPQPSQSALVKV